MSGKAEHLYVLGTKECPYCLMLMGAVAMVTGGNAEDMMTFYDAKTNRRQFGLDTEGVVPQDYGTIPQIVAQYRDGSPRFVGGFTDFIKTMPLKIENKSTVKRYKRLHIMGASWCPYCVMAKGAALVYFRKQTLEAAGDSIVFYDADTPGAAAAFRSNTQGIIPANYGTIPQVVGETRNGALEFIGGFSELTENVRP